MWTKSLTRKLSFYVPSLSCIYYNMLTTKTMYILTTIIPPVTAETDSRDEIDDNQLELTSPLFQCDFMLQVLLLS